MLDVTTTSDLPPMSEGKVSQTLPEMRDGVTPIHRGLLSQLKNGDDQEG